MACVPFNMLVSFSLVMPCGICLGQIHGELSGAQRNPTGDHMFNWDVETKLTFVIYLS